MKIKSLAPHRGGGSVAAPILRGNKFPHYKAHQHDDETTTRVCAPTYISRLRVSREKNEQRQARFRCVGTNNGCMHTRHRMRGGNVAGGHIRRRPSSLEVRRAGAMVNVEKIAATVNRAHEMHAHTRFRACLLRLNAPKIRHGTSTSVSAVIS